MQERQKLERDFVSFMDLVVMKKNVKNEAQETNFAFRFYKVMGYPVPQLRAFFAWRIAENEGIIAENGSEKAGKKFVLPDFSWSEVRSPLLSEFLAFLQKWSRLTRNFPFVQQIFLANSLSFNGLKADSDLDLFVITKKGRIRTARLIMSLMMLFF